MYRDIVKTIINAREKNTSGELGCLNFDSLTIENAYEFQKEIIKLLGLDVVGWKLGGTNAKTRNTFNVKELYWGPIFKGDMLYDSHKLKLKRGEVEVALKLNSKIVDLTHKIYPNDLSLYIDSVALSVEFPWSVFNSFGTAGVRALVADCCASGQCILGDEIPFGEFTGASQITISIDGKKSESCSTSILIDGLYNTVCDFINMSLNKGFELKTGQWVFTGGLSTCKIYESGNTVEVYSDSLPDITFRVK